MSATRPALLQPLDTVYLLGPGEVGRRLGAALRTAGVEVVEVTRSAGWELATGGTDALRLVCVREEDLGGVLGRLCNVPPDRLALVQNGWLRPFLDRPEAVTRGLIWFTSKGGFFQLLRPSPFAGPAAAPLADALARGGIAAQAVDPVRFAGLEADKMGFNCVVGLPLAVHGVSLGTYLERYRAEAEALFTESVTICARALGVAPDLRWWPAFLASAEPLSWVKTGQPKALEFRNRAVVRLAAELGLEAPVNARLLASYASPEPVEEPLPAGGEVVVGID